MTCVENQSYEVLLDNGTPTRRNRVHLRPAEAPAPDITRDATPLAADPMHTVAGCSGTRSNLGLTRTQSIMH